MKTKDLAFALKLVTPGLTSLDYVPAFAHFCFDDGVVTAYNGIMAVQASLDLGFTCCTHGQTLNRLVALAGKKVQLEYEKGELRFVSSRTKAFLPTIPREDFKFEVPSGKAKEKVLLSKEFLEAVSLCLTTASKDAHATAYTCVCVTFGEEPLLCATDGMTFLGVTLPAALGNKSRKLLLPHDLCKTLLHLASTLQVDPSSIKMSVYDGHVSFEFEGDHGVVLSSTLADDKFPDWHKWRTTYEGNGKTIPVPDGLVEAIEKTCVVLDLETDKTVSLSTSGTTLTLDGKGALGRTTTTLDLAVKKEVPARTVVVDPDHVLRVIGRATHLRLEPKVVWLYGEHFAYGMLEGARVTSDDPDDEE